MSIVKQTDKQFLFTGTVVKDEMAKEAKDEKEAKQEEPTLGTFSLKFQNADDCTLLEQKMNEYKNKAASTKQSS